MCTLLARATVDVRDGEMFLVKHQVFTQDRNSFQQFSGRISPAGKVRVKAHLGALFGKFREYSFTVNGACPTLYRLAGLYVSKTRNSGIGTKPERSCMPGSI